MVSELSKSRHLTVETFISNYQYSWPVYFCLDMTLWISTFFSFTLNCFTLSVLLSWKELNPSILLFYLSIFGMQKELCLKRHKAKVFTKFFHYGVVSHSLLYFIKMKFKKSQNDYMIINARLFIWYFVLLKFLCPR